MGLNDDPANAQVNTSEPVVVNEESRSISTRKGINRMTPTRKRIKVLEMAALKVPQADIARAVALPKSTVKDIVKRFTNVLDGLPHVNDYREVRANILAAGHMSALESAFSGKKLQKASFLATIKGAAELHKMERLELKLSTENVSHGFTIAHIHDRDKEDV